MAKKHKTVRGKRGGTDAEIEARYQQARRKLIEATRGHGVPFDEHRRQRDRRRAALVALGIVLALVVLIAAVFAVADKLGAF